MNIPQELPSPMLDAASESQPDEPSDSTATPEPDALQDSPTITQPLMPSTPENSVQYTDSYFTRQLEDHEERVITNKFVGNVYMYFECPTFSQTKFLPYTVPLIPMTKICAHISLCCQGTSTEHSTKPLPP